tara:strand:- start:5097 stop:5264 length:168 start_codon:yes stop_codon:yes gene_type:complete
MYSYSEENYYEPPNEDIKIMSLWKQIGQNAKDNNIGIKFFKVNQSQHDFFHCVNS